MATHWTYVETFNQASDLEQGDILKPSATLKSVFSNVHPHFCDDKYAAFLVATQSCDLVRRDERSKASYVSLVVVRPLSQVISRLIDSVTRQVGQSTFLTSGKGDARRLLERLLNQNEQALGLFFLHQEADSGVGEHSVALLRVSVSLRSEHYETIRGARVGRLTPEFQAKLGWLLGNLYGRPATPDWQDKPAGRKKLDDLINVYLDEQIAGLGPRWLDDEAVHEAKRRGLDPVHLSLEEINALKPKQKHDRALDEITDELSRVAPGLSLETVKKLRNRLSNNGKFLKLFSARPG